MTEGQIYNKVKRGKWAKGERAREKEDGGKENKDKSKIKFELLKLRDKRKDTTAPG